MSDGKRKRYWLWRDTTVVANTKSEARKKFKDTFGLKRLPVGAIVVERR